MTDEDILALAATSGISVDPWPDGIAVCAAPTLLAFCRNFAGDLMRELAQAKADSAVLDWRAQPRAVPEASPMSDSDLVPLP